MTTEEHARGDSKLHVSSKREHTDISTRKRYFSSVFMIAAYHAVGASIEVRIKACFLEVIIRMEC